jgi:hypothetical protein
MILTFGAVALYRPSRFEGELLATIKNRYLSRACGLFPQPSTWPWKLRITHATHRRCSSGIAKPSNIPNMTALWKRESTGA